MRGGPYSSETSPGVSRWADADYFVHCQSGYRSMIASSLLKNKGFNVIEIKDGFNGIKKTKTLEII